MPHFTGKPLKSINITGYLFPWDKETDLPVLLRSHPDDKNPAYMLPIFSTAEKLYEAMREWLKPDGPWKIKQIQDGIDFINSIHENQFVRVIIAADPYIVNGNTRFTAVYRDVDVN